jgi:uncharacterized protein YcfJ
MNGKAAVLVLLALIALGACATGPTGPTVAVMPAPGVPFEKFQADDVACRQWADQQIGGASASDTANNSALKGGVLGTLIGAGLGAAIGSATGNAGAGAAIGGATGLVGGTAMGSNAGAQAAAQLQRRYDIAYMQCMYSKGHQTPAGFSPQPVNRQASGADIPPQAEAQAQVLEADAADSTPLDVTKISFDEPQAAKPQEKTAASRRIMEVQQLLNQKGYAVGTPDGKMGSKTKAAIAKFQGDKKLKVTGTLTTETVNKLKEP